MYFLHLVCYPGFEANFSGQSVGVTDRAGVDDSKLVPTSSSAARRQTDFTTAKRQSLVPVSQSNPPTHEGSSSSGRVEVIWQSLGDRGFSDEAARLITSSWTSGTDKQYNSALKQWCSWCTQRKVDTLQPPVNEVANFLSKCFADGKSSVLLTRADLLYRRLFIH